MRNFYSKVIKRALNKPNHTVSAGDKQHLGKLLRKIQQGKELSDNDITVINQYTGL